MSHKLEAEHSHAEEDEFLVLGNSQPFGMGGRRVCYVHPLDPKKCIKVLRTDAKRTIRVKQGLLHRFRRTYDNNAHEMRVLTRLEHRVGSQMASHLPRSYGMAKTDLGPGLVLDLVRDHDDQISLSVRQLITMGQNLSTLWPAFNDLGEFLLHHNILTRHILDHNIAAQKRGDGTFSFYIIDGLGDPAWLPLRQWIKPLGRTRIRARLAHAWGRFEHLASIGGVSQDLIDKSNWDQGMLRHRG